MHTELSRRVEAVKERLAASQMFQRLFLASCLMQSCWHRVTGDAFSAADATLRYSRILMGLGGDSPRSSLITRLNGGIVRRCSEAAVNPLLASYVRSAEAGTYRREFASYGIEHARCLKYPRKNDRPEREGDLLLLKPRVSDAERGVLLVQYNDGIRKLAALYDLPRLAREYRFVLEPSTWGYEEATFLMLLGLPTDVVVQAQYHADYRYIQRVAGNLHPIELGAGDWVDPETFAYDPVMPKRYDVIMVASWLALKRHALLFKALRSMAGTIGRVALVGYPTGGRTAEDIKREAARESVLHLIEVFESVPPARVSELLQQSRVSVMLTRREGANRAIYESLFSNVPVVVSRCNIGVNRAHINEQTGVFASDEELACALHATIRTSGGFTPRAWALANTGYRNSTARLNGLLRRLALRVGEQWTTDIYPKTNRPHAVYVDAAVREAARARFADLHRFLRQADGDRPYAGASLGARAHP